MAKTKKKAPTTRRAAPAQQGSEDVNAQILSTLEAILGQLGAIHEKLEEINVALPSDTSMTETEDLLEKILKELKERP